MTTEPSLSRQAGLMNLPAPRGDMAVELVTAFLDQHRRRRNVRGCTACDWRPEHGGHTDSPDATRRRHSAFNAHLAQLITAALT